MGISYYIFIFDAYGGESTFFPPISVCYILASLHLESVFTVLFIVKKMEFNQNQSYTIFGLRQRLSV